MHKHLCTRCGATIAEGDFDCDLDEDHDFELCDHCAELEEEMLFRLVLIRCDLCGAEDVVKEYPDEELEMPSGDCPESETRVHSWVRIPLE